MINRYPLWKYLVILTALVIGGLYALPNLYGEDPAIQVTTASRGVPAETVQQRVLNLIKDAGVKYKAAGVRNNQFLVRFLNTDDQLKAADAVTDALGQDYKVALSLAPSTPQWLRDINAKPMYLGLDLRGGVHFLMQVDMDAAVNQALDRYVNEFRNLLRENKVRYTDVGLSDGKVQVVFRRAPERERAYQVISNEYPKLKLTQAEQGGSFELSARLSEQQQKDIRQKALEQNITTLRNRVNELGVAEPVIQQQGQDNIVVQLPGVQDVARAKDILGATATLEFRMVDENHFPYTGGEKGPVPPSDKKFKVRDGGYVLLKRDVLLTGDHITDAASGLDSTNGQAQVNIRLDSAGGKIFNRATEHNVGKRMAVVFIENQTVTKKVDGKVKRIRRKDEKVINIAVIQEALGSRFRITGLDSPQEARDLALLLRAGSLAAPIDIVEERTIGPSLGQQNIDQGFEAVAIGFALVVVFMGLYYRVFGLFADAALFINLILIVALLSILQATLTLPGIAGIVLTVGMAVDANVLIFERIREELKVGMSPQAAIHAGYEKALSTIADSNITTLISGVVLFLFGTGPIKGFAVTLSLGILTSMFTAIMGTRALVNLIYGGKRVSRLHI